MMELLFEFLSHYIFYRVIPTKYLFELLFILRNLILLLILYILLFVSLKDTYNEKIAYKALQSLMLRQITL